jgi:Na+/proline symporter
MQLHIVDISIIIAYVAIVVVAGVLMSRRAGKNLDSYFLGDKVLSWYFLGISNASSQFDITGTMWMVYILFVYGLKSVWIPWLWPQFHPIFMMVYLAIWLRRSNVLTGAEWIGTRFGKGQGAELSRLIVAIFALIGAVGFLAYDFRGIGKFAVIFLPWDFSPNTYALIVMGLTAFYVVLGGMYSVVLTDVIQFIILLIASVGIGIIAISKTSSAAISAAVPHDWNNIFFGWRLHLDWSGLINAVNSRIADDGWSLFGIFFMMILFKGILNSMAGPTPNYDMQRVLATRNPKEAALMSWFSTGILLIPRYLMITGITVLAIVFFSPSLNAMGGNVDFEQILPYVIAHFIPVGLIGLLLAGLLAAFMSTFDSTVNAGAAYLVNDIYKKYINPNASDKNYIYMSYACSLLVVGAGILFGYKITSINSALQWIVAGLYGGYVAPNVLKWYWWRLNGTGYFAGMIVGIISCLVFPMVFPKISAINGFPFLLALSTIATIVVTLLTKPEDDETLKKFYTNVRPWGFWKPVYEKVIRENPNFKRNTAFKRDMTNIAVGIIWQTSLVAMPIYLILRAKKPLLISILIIIITSIFLKINWYDKLEKD